jgi:hypothetical protein
MCGHARAASVVNGGQRAELKLDDMFKEGRNRLRNLAGFNLYLTLGEGAHERPQFLTRERRIQLVHRNLTFDPSPGNKGTDARNPGGGVRNASG